MVDINLIGDEERREERLREESFAKTVSLDTRELQNEDRPFTFDKRTVREVNDSSRKLVYGVLLAIILLGIAAILYFMPKKNAVTQAQRTQTQIGEPQPVSPEVTTESPESMTTTEPATEAPSPATTTATTMTPMEQSIVEATQLGTWTVAAAARAFNNSEGRFLLISYFADRRFLVQFISPREEVTTSITQAVQQNLQPAELKVFPPDRMAMDGQSLDKVLLKGAVSSGRGGAVQGSMQQMSYAQFIGWLGQLAKTRNVEQRSIDPRPAREENGVTRTPVIAKYYGSRADVVDFLNSLAAANPSIDVAKIIVVSADRREFSDDFLELALNFEFIQLP
jgi:hypothetical protein